MENAKKFFEEVVKTEEAKVLLAAVEAPKTEEDRIEIYIDVAKKLGIELTADEIEAYLETLADKTLAEIDDEELFQLVGGADPDAGHAGCESTFTDKEFCISSDGCDFAWNSYEGYLCKLINAKPPMTENEKTELVGKKHAGACGQHMITKMVKEKF